MSSQLGNKAQRLADYLAANKLTKIAGCQEISHPGLVSGQKGLGKEQEQEDEARIDGVSAATSAANNTSSDTVDTPPNCQDLNRSAEAAMAATGTEEKTMSQDGCPASLPKTASYYRNKLAGILNMNKQASDDSVITGTEVMHKLASLGNQPTKAELADASNALIKLASTNPVFGVVRDHILMTKLAGDVEALAEAEGISPEQAAELLDQAAEADPTMAEDAQDEANAEAVEALAGAEEDADLMNAGLEQMAANASEFWGQDVTPEDIMNAIDEVEAQAEEMGVPPEALVQAAVEELQGGEDGGDVSEADLANAQAILDEAAANGVSPEEVIQMAAEDLGGAGEAPEEEPAQEKQASYSAPKQAATPRAAYVQTLLHR